MEQINFTWESRRRLFTVSELTARIRELVAGEFHDLWVAGEISGVRQVSSGHVYFTLKDEQSQVRCVCFRATARLLRFKPQDGVAVLARGRIDVYEQRGEYQLLVETLEPRGYGALQLAFDQLKNKLASEGLFDPARKRPLPRLPLRIGIVTSPDGAAVRDLIEILSRRFPGVHIRLYPALVQGPGSVEAVVAGIRHFARSRWPQVVIVGRGGGSLEDLWTFNEEALARAIAACPVPVVSAVGHETDFTITDFVADVRAPTPSAAAEMVIPVRQQILDQIEAGRDRMGRVVRVRLAESRTALHRQGIDRARGLLRHRIGRSQQRMDEIDFHLRDLLRAKLAGRRSRWLAAQARLRELDLRLRLARARGRLERAWAGIRQQGELFRSRPRRRLEALAARLTALSPVAILERGYAIVETAEGGIVKEARQAQVGSRVGVRLWRGLLSAEVKESTPDPTASFVRGSAEP